MMKQATSRARLFIYLARQSAAKYGSQTIDTEHLLLGILHEDPDVISRFLPSKTAKEIRAEIESRIAKNTASTRIEIPLSFLCKVILAYSAEEAERLHHRHINVDHFLIGVVREEDGTAGQIFRSAGLNVIYMRGQMLLDETATE